MPPAGWGRRAGGKVDSKLEDDELFKAIGGQLDSSNFDYAQWQRTSEKKVPSAKVAARKPPQGLPRKDADDRPTTGRITGFTVSSGAGSWMRSDSADSCHHGQRKRIVPKKESALDEARDRKKAEQIKILQLRIRTRKQTIEEYKKRHAQLLIENMKMRDQIESEEGDSHFEVKKLLRKYEKFRGGITTLNDKFQEEFESAKRDLENTRMRIELDIAGLQKQVNHVDEKVQARLGELNVLMSYKDKEYPVKALKISELKKEIDGLKIAHKEEEAELRHIVDTEVDKFRKEKSKTKQGITEEVVEKSFKMMHSSLKDMALQNMVMEKEMDFHKKNIGELHEENRLLDEEVKSLLKDPKTSIRQQMFPEFYPSREKCTPEMDVILDIPTHEWLPI